MSKNKSSRLTKEDIRSCFAERTGLDVRLKDIRVSGNWLFHREYDDEILCYDVRDARHNSGVLCMEAWSDCTLGESPFVPNNKEKVAKTIQRLDKGYQRYLKEIKAMFNED